MSLKTNTAAGQQTVPKTISDQILEIAKNGASVASQTNIFQAKGEYKYLADMGNTPATILAEMATLSTFPDPNFKEIVLKHKRMVSAIEVTQDAIKKGVQPLFGNHINNLLANRIMLGIEDQMFNSGDKDGTVNLQNILLHNTAVNGTFTYKLEDIFVKTAASQTVLTHQELMDTYIQFAKQPENLDGAIWVVDDITKLSAVKDSAQNHVLTFDNLPAGAVGRVLGIPVYKVSAFTAGQKVAAVLINPAKAYAISISKDAEVQTIIGDTIQQLKHASVSLAEVYIAGMVVNPRAVVIIKLAP